MSPCNRCVVPCRVLSPSHRSSSVPRQRPRRKRYHCIAGSYQESCDSLIWLSLHAPRRRFIVYCETLLVNGIYDAWRVFITHYHEEAERTRGNWKRQKKVKARRYDEQDVKRDHEQDWTGIEVRCWKVSFRLLFLAGDSIFFTYSIG